MKTRRRAPAIAGASVLVLAAALLVRLPLVLTEGGVVTRFSTASDSRGYDALAASLVARGEFGYGGHPTAFRPPLYPLFVAGAYAVSGGAPRAARLAQSLFFLLLVPVTWALTGRLADRRAAGLAGALAAVYPIFIHYSTELLSESLAIVLVPLGWLVWLRLDERPTLARAAAAGVVFEAILMLRPALLPALALAALALPLGRFPAVERRRRLAAAVAIVVVAGVLHAPWVARNFRVFGVFIPFGTYAGSALYDGVTEYRSTDWGEHKERFRREVGAHRADFERRDPGQAFPEIEVERRARGLALEEIREHPGRFLVTLAAHAEVLSIGIHRSDLAALAAGRLPFALAVGTLPYWGIAALALCWLLPRRRDLPRPALWVLAATLVGMVSILPFTGSVRYRVPLVDPLLIPFAASALLGWFPRFAGARTPAESMPDRARRFDALADRDILQATRTRT